MVYCLCVSTCAKAFTSKRKLCYQEQRCNTCKHMVKFCCGECRKMFSTPGYLKQHEMVHSNVKNFKCGICDAAFKWKCDRTRHEEGHSDVRNFKCYICDQRFNRKSSCTRHEEGHLGIKNFKCMKCDKSFANHYHALSHEKICRQNAVPVNDCRDVLNLTDNEVSVDGQMDGNEESSSSLSSS